MIFFLNGRVKVLEIFLKYNGYVSVNYCYVTSHPKTWWLKTTVYYFSCFCRLARWLLSCFHAGSLIKHSVGGLADLEGPRWPHIMWHLVTAISHSALVFLTECLVGLRWWPQDTVLTAWRWSCRACGGLDSGTHAASHSPHSLGLGQEVTSLTQNSGGREIDYISW